MYLRSSGGSISKGSMDVVIWLFKHFNISNIMLGFSYRFLVLNLELKDSLLLFVPQTLLPDTWVLLGRYPVCSWKNDIIVTKYEWW